MLGAEIYELILRLALHHPSEKVQRSMLVGYIGAQNKIAEQFHTLSCRESFKNHNVLSMSLSDKLPLR
jgi:hypothetical protein